MNEIYISIKMGNAKKAEGAMGKADDWRAI